MCVCVLFPFILDVKFVGRTSRGHTGGRSHMISHPPSFCGACLNFSRKKDSAIPFPRRPCSKRERFFGGTKKTTSQVDIFNIIHKRPTTVFTLKLSRRSNGGSYKEVRSRQAKSLPYCLVRTTAFSNAPHTLQVHVRPKAIQEYRKKKS